MLGVGVGTQVELTKNLAGAGGVGWHIVQSEGERIQL